MSSTIREELSNLTNDQLRSRLLQHGLGNMPVTETTRKVLISKLAKTLQEEKTTRRETIHVTNHTSEETSDSKPAAASKRSNRRNTFTAVPTASEDVAPVAPTKNVRRSGRITPTLKETGSSSSIAAAPTETDIIEVDEEPVRETYVPPKRTSRSPSLGKSQTVVTSYKTEISKPIVIVESTEEDEEEDEEVAVGDDVGTNNLYPSLPTNGFNISPIKKQPTLGRTTTHTSYQPSYSRPSIYDTNYGESSTFKAPLSRPSSSTTGFHRQYTSSYASRIVNEDDSAEDQSDIDAPYLSDFAKRLSQLRPEPLDRKIIADVKQHYPDNSFWQSFSNLVNAFVDKFGKIVLACFVLMIAVFIYVFVIG